MGRTFHVEGRPGEPPSEYHVVGLVIDSKYDNVREELKPIAYLSHAQEPEPLAFLQVVIRSETGAGDPNVVAGVDRLTRAISADPRFADAMSMTSLVPDLGVTEYQAMYADGFRNVPDELAPHLSTMVNLEGDRDTTVVLGFLASDPGSREGWDSAKAVRNEIVPAVPELGGMEVLVGGTTLAEADATDGLYSRFPFVIGIILTATFLLLLVLFRSVLVPLKAVVLNLLSVLAAYGLLVLVFQKGGPAIGKTIADLNPGDRAEITRVVEDDDVAALLRRLPDRARGRGRRAVARAAAAHQQPRQDDEQQEDSIAGSRGGIGSQAGFSWVDLSFVSASQVLIIVPSCGKASSGRSSTAKARTSWHSSPTHRSPPMTMKKTPLAASPADYVAKLRGWQAITVRRLRASVRSAARLDEQIKWGNLVYISNGPVLVIRAEPRRVLFGFWRGQRLRSIEPRLKPGGKYEMATLALTDGATLSPAVIRRLTRAAVALNRKLGNPAIAVKPARSRR